MAMSVYDFHTPAASELTHIVQTQKIPNAFIFAGNPGIGKERAAYNFAQAVNCRVGTQGKPCLSCPSCRKIEAHMHPDMLHIGLPEKKKEISIAQIREMERLIAQRPHEALWRMVLILDAEKMTVQAQNGLLKVLEEPPEKTFFILTARGLAGLVSTIISRCRQIRFRPLTENEMIRFLEQKGADPGMAAIASKTAGPDLNTAMTLLNLAVKETPKGPKPKDWLKRRTWIIRQILDLIRWRHQKENHIFLSERLSREPDLILTWMAIIRSVIRDLCIYRHTQEKIVNLDFLDAFKDINQTISGKQLIELMDIFYETEQRLETNASIRLTLDRFFIKLSFA